MKYTSIIFVLSIYMSIAGCNNELNPSVQALSDGPTQDEEDLELATIRDALDNAVSGITRSWQNNSGSHGMVTPGPLYSIRNYPCRDMQIIYVSAQYSKKQRHSTFCRHSDGLWRELKESK